MTIHIIYISICSRFPSHNECLPDCAAIDRRKFIEHFQLTHIACTERANPTIYANNK